MKIIVKNPDINILNSYIKKGADAFLFGIKGFSINNRCALTTASLQIIKNMIGDDKPMFIELDKIFSNKELASLEKLLIKLDTMKFDGIFFHDVAVLNIATRLDLKTDLIWDQSFMATNYETINYYISKGIKGTVLANVITTKDMVAIAHKLKNISFFVNIFGYQMASFSKRELLTNYFKYHKKSKTNKMYLITDEKSEESYPIIENIEGTMIYSSNILNGIMEINKLKQANIGYVIMDEYLISHIKFMDILDLYAKGIHGDLDDAWLRTYNMEIKKNYKNMDDGFFNKETIYKV
ncbi:MAG TPA: U32 family peptidase, partial [Bacilli bacterium]|nr:U32 family peptidase [Bacilli bacterium]